MNAAVCALLYRESRENLLYCACDLRSKRGALARGGQGHCQGNELMKRSISNLRGEQDEIMLQRTRCKSALSPYNTTTSL